MTPEQFLAFASPLPEAMLFVDGDGLLLAANSAAEKLLGISGRELIGASVTDLTTDPAEKVAGFLRTCSRSSALVPGSLTWRMPAGEECACRCLGTAVRRQTEDAPCLIMLRCKPRSEENKFMILNKQFDALQKMHADLLDRKRHLEQEVRDRTQELERSNRELEQFAYIASHDLQEPLRKVLTFGDRLKTKCGDAVGAQGQDYLERMQSAALRMQKLINDLLIYSRVTTKAQPPEPVDLGRVVGEVLADLEIRVEESGGRVEVGDLPTVDADPLQMRQLFQNLIGNALKYQKKDEPPTVKVHGFPLGSNGKNGQGKDEELFQITIEDNGIGFEQKYAERIFAPFQRLHGRNEYEGTGIGLSVCKKIVERHNGKIEARSVPLEGTTFIVTFPAKQTGSAAG